MVAPEILVDFGMLSSQAEGTRALAPGLRILAKELSFL